MQLFVCVLFTSYSRTFRSCMGASPLPVKGCKNQAAYSGRTFTAFDQGEILTVTRGWFVRSRLKERPTLIAFGRLRTYCSPNPHRII